MHIPELVEKLIPKKLSATDPYYYDLGVLVESARFALEANITVSSKDKERADKLVEEGRALLDRFRSVEGPLEDTKRVASGVVTLALGQVLNIAGNFQAARDAFLEAGALTPDFFEAYYELGQLYFDKKRGLDNEWPQRAETMFLEARRVNLEEPSATIELARLYTNKVFSRHQEAIDLLKPLGPSVIVSKIRASAHQALGQHAAALSELRNAMPLGNDEDREELRKLFIRFAIDMPYSGNSKDQVLEEGLEYADRLLKLADEKDRAKMEMLKTRMEAQHSIRSKQIIGRERDN